MWKKPRNLDDCHNIADLRELSRRRLPGPFFHFLDGAAETEYTASRNTAAFNEINLIPRCLVDVSSVDTSTTVLGQDIEWPVICAPTGASRFFHAQGELAVARAAADAGTLYSLSVMSTYSLEEVAAVSAAPKMFQLYIFRDRDFTQALIERCKRADYRALCLTVDTAVPGNRERDLRTGLGVPPKFTLANIAGFTMHPGWLVGLASKGPLSMPNVADWTGSNNIVAHSKFFGEQLDPSVTWKDVREIIEVWGGPFALKGILSVDDARRAVDIGATAIIVSNHGGRQLDGSATSIEVLPDIVAAVGDQIEVILDGGIRRGTHVLKALACGAKACSIGRPYLYGLGAGGEAGVTKALHILRTEIVRAMTLSGCTDVEDLDESFVSSKHRLWSKSVA
ncbi:MAG: alpha-hydroxy-acid oxidizing protein [Gammaproteobacteria bacterium]|nr:alpha-hydroxy-acid oxidizing protein [Gammaproteobacteria bacterium]